MKQTKVNFIIIFAILILFSCKQSYFRQGENLYLAQCASCHMNDGSGLNLLIPALQYEEQLKISEIKNLTCIIRNGIQDPSNSLQMPPYPNLSATEVTNIINYLLNDLNQDVGMTTLPQTNAYLEECK